RETTRDTVELKLVLSPGTAQRLTSEPNLRILVYCTADSGLTPFTKSEIAFPQQVELKVNFDSVPAKLRGLKNKPGTTNPVDITGWIRKKGGYPNKIDLIYALTTKRYFVVANLVQRHPVDELVKRLRSRVITAQQVLQESAAQPRRRRRHRDDIQRDVTKMPDLSVPHRESVPVDDLYAQPVFRRGVFSVVAGAGADVDVSRV
ncbi:hypothetical protein KEM56_004822, partial [Ascosphaera pollenicola]